MIDGVGHLNLLGFALLAILVAIVLADDLLALFLPVGGIRFYRRYFPIEPSGFRCGRLLLLDGVGEGSLVGNAVAVVHVAHLPLDYSPRLVGICSTP